MLSQEWLEICHWELQSSCHVKQQENMPLWKAVDLGKAVRFGYIKWVLFGCFLYFKDFPVGTDHEKGQHPSRTIEEILQENSLSPLWSCKNSDYQGSLSVRPKQRDFVPPCTAVQDNSRNLSSTAWKAGFDSLMALVPKLP